MENFKEVLVVSDDGYQAPGLRILVQMLKGDFNVKVAVTKTQQSGVGAKLHLKHGGKWSIKEVEGEKALCIDGSPVDAVECAQAYFKQHFDLVVSGINWGENIGGAMLGSGTVNAAAWAVNIGIASKALAFSWKVDPKYWFHDHEFAGKVSDDLLIYPGDTVMRLINLAEKNHFWGATMLNINLPEKMTAKIRFGLPVDNLQQVYWYPLNLDREKKTYTYVPKYAKVIKAEVESDFGLINEGMIAITPCQTNIVDTQVWQKYGGKEFEL